MKTPPHDRSDRPFEHHAALNEDRVNETDDDDEALSAEFEPAVEIDDACWEVFIADEDECDPLPEPHDFCSELADEW